MARGGRELECVVVTPERQVLQEKTASVVIPAHDGELGVLPGRAPLLCELGIGQLRYRTPQGVRRLFIDGGFAQVYEDRVTVLTERAVPAEDITSDLVREAERRAGEQPIGQERARANRRAEVLRNLRRTVG